MDPLSKGRQAAEEERRVRGSGDALGPFAWVEQARAPGGGGAAQDVGWFVKSDTNM